MDWSAKSKSAESILRAKGAAMTLRVVSEGTYDPSTGTASGVTTTDTTCYGIMKTPSVQDAGQAYDDGSMVLAADMIATIGAHGLTAAPTPGNILVIGGDAWTIKRVKPLAPANVAILYSCFIREA